MVTRGGADPIARLDALVAVYILAACFVLEPAFFRDLKRVSKARGWAGRWWALPLLSVALGGAAAPPAASAAAPPAAMLPMRRVLVLVRNDVHLVDNLYFRP